MGDDIFRCPDMEMGHKTKKRSTKQKYRPKSSSAQLMGYEKIHGPSTTRATERAKRGPKAAVHSSGAKKKKRGPYGRRKNSWPKYNMGHEMENRGP